MSINILDSTIANRISAGEVVERPASIVKELIDNAVDAGAKNITIEIMNGGIDYIKVADDGCGIDEADVKKAFLPHATSKIKTLEDLDNIFTLGFRGEALASIVSVSQATMRTKTDANELASVIDVNGGVFSEVRKIAGITGTNIEVKNLFYNTPARRKFLRKPKQEENEITNVVSRYILAKPSIKFKYIVEHKTVFSSSGTTLLDAISCVYNNETAQNVIKVDVTDNNTHIYGYVSKVSFTKPNTSYQTLLVNGRYVVDETVSKAVYIAYEEFLMSRQFPFYVINIDMPFTDVDVNVHPNKLTIKFSKPSTIFDLVYHEVRRAIYNFVKPKTNNSTTTISELPIQPNEVSIDAPMYDSVPLDNKITFKKSFGNNVSMFDKYANNKITFKTDIKNDAKLCDELESQILIKKELVANNNDIKQIDIKNKDDVASSATINNIEQSNSISKEPNIDEGYNNIQGSFISKPENQDSYQSITNFSEYKTIGELFSEFLILEKDNKMLLVDFHAGHERLLYDQLIQNLSNKKIVIQDLLIPYTQVMTPKEVDYILQFKDDLEKLGFGIDQFSPNEIKVSYVPLLVKDINLKSFIDDLLNDINNCKPKVAYELDKYLMKSACRSAVKAGQVLNEMQIKELLKNLDINNPILLCPHGRPIVTVITRNQIEKWFKRIV